MAMTLPGELLGMAPQIILFSVLLALDAMFIRREERNLEATFGVKYLEYKKQVRRWL